jgi:uncharacterized small protein (DUF1192 family)
VEEEPLDGPKGEGQQQRAQQPQRPPGLDMRAYVSQLEEKVQALKGEVARVNAAKQDELGSARGVVEQLRRELDAARHARVGPHDVNIFRGGTDWPALTPVPCPCVQRLTPTPPLSPQTQVQEQLEGMKREYQQRVAALKEAAARAEAQAEQASREAASGQMPEEERRRIMYVNVDWGDHVSGVLSFFSFLLAQTNQCSRAPSVVCWGPDDETAPPDFLLLLLLFPIQGRGSGGREGGAGGGGGGGAGCRGEGGAAPGAVGGQGAGAAGARQVRGGDRGAVPPPAQGGAC